MGLSLKNVALSAIARGKTRFSEQGEMLFTHFGISGPLVLTLSSALAREDWSKVSLSLDMKPALSEKQLDDRLLREFAANPRRQLQNVLPALLPSRMAEIFPALCGMDGHMGVSQINAAQRQKLVQTLKALPMSVVSPRGYEEAIITCGGVQVKEIDPSTMMSRKVPGLYFAGEVLDVDAYTGGFNLQIAFSTGALAGNAAAGYQP